MLLIKTQCLHIIAFCGTLNIHHNGRDLAHQEPCGNQPRWTVTHALAKGSPLGLTRVPAPHTPLEHSLFLTLKEQETHEKVLVYIFYSAM